MQMGRLRFVGLSLALSTLVLGCKKDEAPQGPGGDVPPPPPSAAVAKAGGCANAAPIDDPVSTGFFPKTVGTFCVDSAAGAVKTYGAKAKLSMDAVCTTAFDGECEIYKQYGLTRVVTLRYVDGGAQGAGTVEIVLSQFETDGGGYGMFTKRVIADADPTAPEAPKAVTAVGAAAMGGGRAYAWRGNYLVELTYMNEQETPAKMVKSSEAILPQLAKAITDRLTGNSEKPAPVKSLPEANLVPLGVSFAPKDAMGIKGLAPAAIGYYKDGEKRYRVLVAALDGEAAAKEAMKAIKAKPGALPVAGLGDEALQVVNGGVRETPKTEWVYARKGAQVIAFGDEELVIAAGQPLDKQASVRLSKDEKVAKAKPLFK